MAVHVENMCVCLLSTEEILDIIKCVAFKEQQCHLCTTSQLRRRNTSFEIPLPALPNFLSHLSAYCFIFILP